MTTHPVKITFGGMRDSGVRDVLIYCRDHRCSHHVEANADGWGDDVRRPAVGYRGQVCLSGLGPAWRGDPAEVWTGQDGDNASFNRSAIAALHRAQDFGVGIAVGHLGIWLLDRPQTANIVINIVDDDECEDIPRTMRDVTPPKAKRLR